MAGRIVFRGSASTPNVKFRDGFTARNPRPGGVQIQPGGQMIGGVSTSKDFGSALRYAGNYAGYLYVIYVPEGDGIDVIDYMYQKSREWFADRRWKQGLGNAVTQMEVALDAVPGATIIASRKTKNERGKCLLDSQAQIQINANHTAPQKLATQALEWLALTDLEVDENYH